MAVMTAQMLIGHGHQTHGGLEPTHYLFLSTNGRQAWILAPENLSPDDPARPWRKIIWIPTDEHTLEDGLLMLGLHVVQDKDLIAAARDVFRNPDLTALQILKQVPGPAREFLYSLTRRTPFHFKIILSVFAGSSLIPQLGRLREYQLDVDVLTFRFGRGFSHTENRMVTKGKLEPSA
jgi:hypothetical protein